MFTHLEDSWQACNGSLSCVSAAIFHMEILSPFRDTSPTQPVKFPALKNGVF